MINLINKRENHLRQYNEFNKLEQHPFTMQDIANWANIIQQQKGSVRILELGTRRSSGPTHHKAYFSYIPNLDYVMTDYQPGLDVDVVCDLHRTAGVFADKSFDLILSCSTYEHLKYPQLCSHNLMKMLKVGGRILIQTHQSFPLHGYKYDYYRFSREALKSLFSESMKFRTITSYFTHNCMIVPHSDVTSWNDVAESYLNVFFIAEKADETPDTYIYNLDVV